MDHKIRQRLHWVELFEKTSDAGLVCRRCGISRSTLRLWVRRYQQHGQNGLTDRSRRPTNSPATKVFERQEQWILTLRCRRLGAGKSTLSRSSTDETKPAVARKGRW
ncbi:MAG TPA: helix-turn-helix domain-containing protein [Pyrinomonadaceae bacterium]